MNDGTEIVWSSTSHGVTQRGGVAEIVEQMRLARGGGAAMAAGARPQRSYSQVSAVYACVKARADALSLLPHRISTIDEQVLETGPIVNLVERPNPRMTGRGFQRATEAHLLLFGRVHWVFTLTPGGLPIEVVPVCPLQMKPVCDRATGELLAWKFTPAGMQGARPFDLPLGQVHTIIDPDFEDNQPFEGLSPRRAATLAISQYFKSDVANESSMDNGVEPSAIFTMSGTPTPDQIKDFRQNVSERHAGVNNRNRHLLIYGGVDVKTIARSFSDMEFRELKGMARTDICAAFSVPPACVGFYEDSNYAHADAAEQGFWTKVILPRAAWIAEEWDLGVVSRFNGDRSLAMAEARSVAPRVAQRRSMNFQRARETATRTGQRFYSWFDSSGVPAVQKGLLGLADQVQKWTAAGVPLNTLSHVFYLPFEDFAWGDTWYKPMGLIDVKEDVIPGADDPTGAPGDDEAATLPSDEPTRGTGKRSTPRISGPHAGSRERRLSDATLARIWHAWRASWAALDHRALNKLRRHFNELRGVSLKLLADAAPQLPAAKGMDRVKRRDLIASLLFDLAESNAGLIAKLGPLIREAYRLGGNQVMQEAADAEGGKAKPFDDGSPEVAAKIRQREIKVTGINRTLQKRLGEQLADGLAGGESGEQLAQRVKDEFGFAYRRAKTIAMTEVGAAVEDARQVGREKSGVPLKSWLWSRKETGREHHQQTEDETMDSPVPNEADFVIAQTGHHAKAPRLSGHAEDDVNCGCTTVSRYPGDSLKSMMGRYAAKGFLTYEKLLQRDAAAITPGDAGHA